MAIKYDHFYNIEENEVNIVLLTYLSQVFCHNLHLNIILLYFLTYPK